jgi:hypothetical protein
MATHESDFPYAEIRDSAGDYWQSLSDCIAAGYALSQIWSVTVTDCDDDSTVWCYGPAHHYVDRIGYVATTEHHDADTYYVEVCELDN